MHVWCVRVHVWVCACMCGLLRKCACVRACVSVQWVWVWKCECTCARVRISPLISINIHFCSALLMCTAMYKMVFICMHVWVVVHVCVCVCRYWCVVCVRIRVTPSLIASSAHLCSCAKRPSPKWCRNWSDAPRTRWCLRNAYEFDPL